MAHENNKNKTYKSVSVISKNVSKKGKLKGKNKKETKFLKRACTHHVYKNNGKLKSKFFNNGDGRCICELCARSFQTKIETKDNIRERCEDVLNILNQLTTMGVSGGLGEKFVEKIVNTKVCIEELPKDYERAATAISKVDNIKKKNKNKNNNGGGSSQYGGWSHSK